MRKNYIYNEIEKLTGYSSYGLSSGRPGTSQHEGRPTMARTNKEDIVAVIWEDNDQLVAYLADKVKAKGGCWYCMIGRRWRRVADMIPFRGGTFRSRYADRWNIGLLRCDANYPGILLFDGRRKRVR